MRVGGEDKRRGKVEESEEEIEQGNQESNPTLSIEYCVLCIEYAYADWATDRGGAMERDRGTDTDTEKGRRRKGSRYGFKEKRKREIEVGLGRGRGRGRGRGGDKNSDSNSDRDSR